MFDEKGLLATGPSKFSSRSRSFAISLVGQR